MAPDVTVIIPAYNAADFIERTLDSVFGQTIGAERVEIVVVDDGSTDTTPEVLARLAKDHPNLVLLHQENSGGPSRPRNNGLDHATGRYVFFLDNDDWLGAEALERLVRCADETGSEIVLGKLVGEGGRRPARSMFTSNQLKTSIFESRAWWTLGIHKLFRRDLIERLGLRFREDLLWEDQPFVGAAYLNANNVSILSDYDYFHFVWRPGMDNVSLGKLPPEGLAGVLEHMLRLITDNVEPGPNRDHLLQRHFDVDVFMTVKAMARCEDEAVNRATFERLRGWTLEHYPYEIVRELSPAHRIIHNLLGRDEFELLLDFVRRYFGEAKMHASVEDGRVFATLPGALPADAGIPAECLDVTELLKVRYHLSEVAWRDGVLHLEGTAHLDLFPADETLATLVLRERATHAEHTLPVRRTGSPGHTTWLWQLSTVHERAGIAAEIDPLTAADGARLPDGVWDISLRLASRGIGRETRIGRVRAPEIGSAVTWRLLPEAGEPAMVLCSFFTKDVGNLSLDVGGTERGGVPLVSCDRIAWHSGRAHTVELSGASNVAGLDLASALSVVVRDAAGHEAEAEMHASDDGGYTASVVVRELASRGRLVPGKWSVLLRVRVGDSVVDVCPRVGETLAPEFVWLGPWPHRVHSSQPGARLAVYVNRLDPAMIARALKHKRPR